MIIYNSVRGKEKLKMLQKKRADIDQNEAVTLTDVLLILNYLAKQEEKTTEPEKPSEIINVSSADIKGNKVVVEGETTTLEADIYPKNATYKEVKWYSEDESIAKVDLRTGKVTGIKAGEATSIILEIDGDKAAEHIINVVEKEITNIKIIKQPMKKEYNVGETIDTKGLELEVRDNTGTTSKITRGYKVSPEKATKEGTQIITVNYKGKTITYNVTVKGDDGRLSNKTAVNVIGRKKCPSILNNKSNGYWVIYFKGQPDVNNINMNINSNYESSGAIAMYYANVILGKNPNISAITEDYVLSSNATKTNFPGGGYEYLECKSYEEQIETIYNEIIKGNPVPVEVKNNKGEDTYVLAYAIKGKAAQGGKVLAEDIDVIDTRTGKYNSLSEYYKYITEEGEKYPLAVYKGEVVKLKVDTSSGDKVDLKLREKAETSANIVERLAHGSYVYTTEEKLKEVIKANGYEWIHVTSESGKQGFVAKKYLKEYKNQSSVTVGQGGKTFIEVAERCDQILADKKFVYDNPENSKRYYSDFSEFTPETITNNFRIDCSEYVSWVIYEYAKKTGNTSLMNDFKEVKNSTTMFSYFKESPHFELVGSKLTEISVDKLKAGDIFVKKGHVEIYVSYNKNSTSYPYVCYSAGATAAIQDPNPRGGGCNVTTPSTYAVYRIK